MESGARGDEICEGTPLRSLRCSGIRARGEASAAGDRQPGAGLVVRARRAAAPCCATGGGATGRRRADRPPRGEGGSEPGRDGVRRGRAVRGAVRNSDRARRSRAPETRVELGPPDPRRQERRRRVGARERRQRGPGGQVADVAAADVAEGTGRRADARLDEVGAALRGLRSGGRGGAGAADRNRDRAGPSLQRGTRGGAGAAGHPGVCFTRSEKLADESLPERRDADAQRAARRAAPWLEAARAHPPGRHPDAADDRGPARRGEHRVGPAGRSTRASTRSATFSKTPSS